jgi:imidazoleglycerol-phosphate dehydratase
MSGRTAERRRTTGETDVAVRIDLDGTGTAEIATGVPFLDHMWTLFARHGRFDLTITARGDTEVDDHHTTEDVAIVLGDCIGEALSDKRGIARYGHAYAPMDEALVRTALDISGRPFCVFAVEMPAAKVGTFDTDLVEHVCISLAHHAGITLHVDAIRGTNSHHVIEAVFKSLAVSLYHATRIVRDDLPSTKGTL